MSGVTCLNRFAKQQGREISSLLLFCDSISGVISGDKDVFLQAIEVCIAKNLLKIVLLNLNYYFCVVK